MRHSVRQDLGDGDAAPAERNDCDCGGGVFRAPAALQCLLREFLPIPVIKSYGVSRGVLRRKERRNTPVLSKQNRQSLARIAGRDTELT